MKIKEVIQLIEAQTGKKVVLKESLDSDELKQKISNLCQLKKIKFDKEKNSSGWYKFFYSIKNITLYGYLWLENGEKEIRMAGNLSNKYSRYSITLNNLIELLNDFPEEVKNLSILYTKVLNIVKFLKIKEPDLKFTEFGNNDVLLQPKLEAPWSINDYSYYSKSNLHNYYLIYLSRDTKKIIVESSFNGRFVSVKVNSINDLKNLFPKPVTPISKRKENKLSEIAKQVADDLKYIPFKGYESDKEAIIDKKNITFGTRDLGNWVYSDTEEDDDNAILSDKSYKEIFAKFKIWAKNKEWYKYVRNIDLSPSEKSWLYFIIELK